QSNMRARTNVKGNRLPLRRESLCAKKWNTFGKANTVPDRPSRRSPLVCPRRGGPEENCRLQNAAGNEQSARQSAISKRAASGARKSLPENGPRQRNPRSNERAR